MSLNKYERKSDGKWDISSCKNVFFIIFLSSTGVDNRLFEGHHEYMHAVELRLTLGKRRKKRQEPLENLENNIHRLVTHFKHTYTHISLFSNRNVKYVKNPVLKPLNTYKNIIIIRMDMIDIHSFDWEIIRDVSIFVILLSVLLLLMKCCCDKCRDKNVSDKFRRQFFTNMSQAASSGQLDSLLETQAGQEDIVFQRATTNNDQIQSSDDDY